VDSVAAVAGSRKARDRIPYVTSTRLGIGKPWTAPTHGHIDETTATLGNTEIRRILNSVNFVIPELLHCAAEYAKSPVVGERGDVLEQHRLWPQATHEPKELIDEAVSHVKAPTRPVAGSQAGKPLTGRTSSEQLEPSTLEP
jgi:hypothetical protein